MDLFIPIRIKRFMNMLCSLLVIGYAIIIPGDPVFANIYNSEVVGHYNVRNKVTIDNEDVNLSKLVIILPFAQTNQYQAISNVNLYDGTVLDIPETDDKYVRWTFTSSLPSQGQQKETYYDFDVVLKSYTVDFNQITTIYPYDTNSNTYTQYIGTSGVYIDPYNAEIQAIGAVIWNKSSDIIDYARRCYEYVASNYRYLEPLTGLHPLTEILTDGGGDCGNLNSIYISLLRFKNIPSRHIVTIRPDGSYHVWSDFYMENYGWIPVDVTYKLTNPSGDYFGKYNGNGIVLTKGVWLLLDRGDGYVYHQVLLQSFSYWWWFFSGGKNISALHQLSSSVTSDGTCGSSNGQTFQVMPTMTLCNTGVPTSVAGNGPWSWSCTGTNGGTNANCSANIQTWTVTPSAGANGSISPNVSQTVNHGSTKSFTVTPNAGYEASVEGTCRGTLTGTTYTTNAITGACTVSATFTLIVGDVNGDGVVNLADAIIALQVMAGMQSSNLRSDYMTSGTDVNGDGKVGMPEAIYILQKAVGIQ